MRMSRCQAVCAVLVLCTAIAIIAPAQTFDELYTFTNPAYGAIAWGGVITDSAGNLYGTTVYGGDLNCVSSAYNPGCGTVYQVDASGNEKVLYSFTGLANGDGAGPEASLVRDSEGNLYGTTFAGGGGSCGLLGGCGIVFKIDPTGTETILHVFTGGSDGANPSASLILDSHKNLYGTTYYGGDLSCLSPYPGCGVVFKLEPNGKEVVLHTFTGPYTGGSDGSNPRGPVIRDVTGNLYGTTVRGGNGYGGEGTVFEITPSGNETVLHSFNPIFAVDGGVPIGGLVRDSAGNLYGTTSAFGTATCACGTIFKIDPSGNESLLYSFTGAPDGRAPYSGLVRDAKGNLYGTTNEGGGSSCNTPIGCGVIFKLDTNGKETVLYRFTGGLDGAFPFAGLTPAGSKAYGTASCDNECLLYDTWGTVYSIGP